MFDANQIYLAHAYGEPTSDWLDASIHDMSNRANASCDDPTHAMIYASQRRAPTLSEYDRDNA